MQGGGKTLLGRRRVDGGRNRYVWTFKRPPHAEEDLMRAPRLGRRKSTVTGRVMLITPRKRTPTVLNHIHLTRAIIRLARTILDASIRLSPHSQ